MILCPHFELHCQRLTLSLASYTTSMSIMLIPEQDDILNNDATSSAISSLFELWVSRTSPSVQLVLPCAAVGSGYEILFKILTPRAILQIGGIMALSTVFYIGATGYIGGSVLAELVKTHPELKFTALVRNPAHVGAVRNLGVEVVQGSFSDTDLISSHARAADITINSADSDATVLNEAILTGQRARVVDDGNPPAALLHTSGVAVFVDGGKEGKHDPNGKIWNDANEADIRSITPEMLHGQVDAPILQAAEKGHTESYIICPAAVLGQSRGPVPANSFFFKFMSQLALAFKMAFYVGEGENVFYTVHLDDLVNLYRRVFEHILSRASAKASPYARYYIAVSTPYSWKHITTTIGAVLARIGKLEDGKPHSISISNVPPPASLFLGATQNVRGERAKDLGWEPRPVVLEDWADEGVRSAVATLQ